MCTSDDKAAPISLLATLKQTAPSCRMGCAELLAIQLADWGVNTATETMLSLAVPKGGKCLSDWVQPWAADPARSRCTSRAQRHGIMCA